MENNYAPPQSDVTASNSSGGVSNRMLEALSGTKPWALLVGIVLLIFAVLAIIGTIMLVSRIGYVPSRAMPIFLLALGVYVLVSLFYLFSGIYLVKYSSAIGRVLISRSAEHMEESLFAQKSFWKLVGIMTVIAIILFVVMLVVGANNPRIFRMF